MASKLLNLRHVPFKKVDARLPQNAKALGYLEERAVDDLDYLQNDVGLLFDKHNPTQLVVPFWTPDGKPLMVDGLGVQYTIKRNWKVPKTGPNKGRKFENPPGVYSPLYFAPIPKRFRRSTYKLAADGKTPLIVTEGAVKAMAIAQHGGFAVAVLGCRNWSANGEPVPEWKLLKLNGRDVIIVYDADVAINTDVQDGLLGLRDMLTERGAKVFICLLDPVGDDRKAGADDWIAAHGYPKFQKFIKDNRLPGDDPAFAEWGSVAQLDFMNKHYAVVMAGSQTRILIKGTPPLTLTTRKDLADYHANKFVGDTPIVECWMEHKDRHTYERIVFDPTGSAPDTDCNVWMGFAVEPKKGKCNLYLNHIREIIAQGDEKVYDYLLAWMADAVQNPTKRPGVAIALRGAQGAGKGVFVTEFGDLFGPHFVPLQSTDMLTGRFNARMEGALIVFADEAIWAGNRSAVGRLKALITEKQIQIERKGVDAYPIQNYARLIAASNEDWIVPAGPMERRFCVLDVGTKRIGDQKYFAAIIEQMNNGGREALLYELQNYNLSKSKVNLRDFPKSNALLEQKLSSMPDAHQFWHEVLDRGALPGHINKWQSEIPKDTVHAAYREWLSPGAKTHAVATEFGTAIKKMCPGVKYAKVTTGKKKRRSLQSRVYHFPSLKECRAQFDALWGQKFPWGDE
jgi:hypothetical protein